MWIGSSPNRLWIAAAGLAAAPLLFGQEPSLPSPVIPRAFGVDAYTATNIPATSFTPRDNTMTFSTSGSLGRFGSVNTITEFYAGVELPGGVVIDYAFLNNDTDTAGVITVELIDRDPFGSTHVLDSLTNTAGGWHTDNPGGPLGILWTGFTGHSLIVKVTFQANPDPQFFGFVELWWKRKVSDAPATATFNDVPTSHPFFQYVEALAASGITAGCGSGNYCPDAPVTRGQMAVFLSKALGLNWPAN